MSVNEDCLDQAILAIKCDVRHARLYNNNRFFALFLSHEGLTTSGLREYLENYSAKLTKIFFPKQKFVAR